MYENGLHQKHSCRGCKNFMNHCFWNTCAVTLVVYVLFRFFFENLIRLSEIIPKELKTEFLILFLSNDRYGESDELSCGVTDNLKKTCVIHRLYIIKGALTAFHILFTSWISSIWIKTCWIRLYLQWLFFLHRILLSSTFLYWKVLKW